MAKLITSALLGHLLSSEDLSLILGFYEITCNRLGLPQEVVEVKEFTDENVDGIISLAQEAGFNGQGGDRKFERRVLDALGTDGPKVFTSYYGNMKQLKAFNIVPVRIAQYAPRYLPAHKAFMPLAPSKEMLAGLKANTLSSEGYKVKYDNILASLKPKQVYAELLKQGEGYSVAILCYERPPDTCHREYVAQWMREAGIEITEFPFI